MLDTDSTQSEDTAETDGSDASTATRLSTDGSESDDIACDLQLSEIEFDVSPLTECRASANGAGGMTLYVSNENENSFTLEHSWEEVRCEKSACTFLCRSINLSIIAVDGMDDDGNDIGGTI